VRIHDPGNPQWPINRFFEKSEVQVEKPSPDKPMPDYANMTDHELLALIKRPWGNFIRGPPSHTRHSEAAKSESGGDTLTIITDIDRS